MINAECLDLTPQRLMSARSVTCFVCCSYGKNPIWRMQKEIDGIACGCGIDLSRVRPICY